MIKFQDFIIESKKPAAGILHIEHPADRTFDGPEAAQHALKTVKGVASGKTPITRKIDDKMSYQAVRTPEGKVGVKYKGSGSTYNFSASDVDRQHGHKPYLAEPLKTLHKHLGKVLPKRPGEYQGGFMSDRSGRSVEAGHISHTPNTIKYSAPLQSKEGQKLAKSKVSTVIHSELKGEHKTAHPITDTSEFGHHPDVHMVQHTVSPEHRQLHPDDKKIIGGHLQAAENLMKDHTYHHLAGHETPLRTYINHTVNTGTKPTVAGYKAHLGAAHDKKIDAVKMQKTKDTKTTEKNAALAHIDKNRAAFQRSLDIHHHIQQATNHLASSLDRHGAGGFHTSIGGKSTGGEGYVGNGLKIVNRHEFSAANAAKRDQFKKQVQEGLSVPLGDTGKRTTINVNYQTIRMANGTLARKVAGKSGSSGGGGE